MLNDARVASLGFFKDNICTTRIYKEKKFKIKFQVLLKKVNEFDQEIPQSQTVDNPWHREEEPFNHHKTPGRRIKQSNQLSRPHQDDCNTKMDIK